MTVAGVSSGRRHVENLDLPVPQPLRHLLHEATSTRGRSAAAGASRNVCCHSSSVSSAHSRSALSARPCVVDLDQTLHLGGVEEAASRDRGRGQHVVDHRLQVADEPGADGRAEPGLRAGRTTLCGSVPSMLFLKRYLRVSRRSFSSGGIRAGELDDSSSSSGTRTSVDAAMLILSVYVRLRHGRKVFRST